MSSPAPAALAADQPQPGPASEGTTDRTAPPRLARNRSGRQGPGERTTAAAPAAGPSAPSATSSNRSVPRSPEPASSATAPTTTESEARTRRPPSPAALARAEAAGSPATPNAPCYATTQTVVR